MELLETIIGLIETACIIGGSMWGLWGFIILAGALKDKNGPAMQSGIWQIVGGVMIIIAAALFKTIL